MSKIGKFLAVAAFSVAGMTFAACGGGGAASCDGTETCVDDVPCITGTVKYSICTTTPSSGSCAKVTYKVGGTVKTTCVVASGATSADTEKYTKCVTDATTDICK